MVNYSKIQKSLDAEFAECDSVDSMPFVAPSARPYFSSMEGGLDDCRLLQMGSPKVEEEKENDMNIDFNLPAIPSPKKQPKYFENSK